MKKKLFLLTAFIIFSVFVLANTGGKEVKAACDDTIYYNYYMFLEATPKAHLTSLLDSNGSYTSTTGKTFNLVVPEGATVVDRGQMEIGLNDRTGNFEYGSYFSNTWFFLVYQQLGPSSIKQFRDTDIDWYATAVIWTDENGINTSSTELPADSDEYYAGVPVNGGNPVITYNGEAEDTFGEVGYNFSIKRTWSSTEIADIASDSIVWSPAAYFISYQYDCEEEPVIPEDPDYYTVDVEFVDVDNQSTKLADNYTITTEAIVGETIEYDCSNNRFDGYVLYADNETNYPTNPEVVVSGNETLTCYYKQTIDNHSLTVEFIDKETGDKLDDSFNSGDIYPEGEPYKYQCKNIQGYTVVNTSDNPSLLEGTFAKEDITRQCYYTRNSYTLTINYGEDEDCTTSLKPSDSYTLKYKDTGTYEVPKAIEKLTTPTLGNFSSQFTKNPSLSGTKLTVTMPAKNVQVCIVYTPQTGVSWIYLAWVIGLLALGYSVWYFVRYYKKQNSEI